MYKDKSKAEYVCLIIYSVEMRIYFQTWLLTRVLITPPLTQFITVCVCVRVHVSVCACVGVCKNKYKWYERGAGWVT